MEEADGNEGMGDLTAEEMRGMGFALQWDVHMHDAASGGSEEDSPVGWDRQSDQGDEDEEEEEEEKAEERRWQGVGCMDYGYDADRESSAHY